MISEILSLLSVILFCLCCSQFLKAIVKPIPVFRTDREYAMGAMKIKKAYSVISWGTMTSVFFTGLVISFYQVFTQL